MAASSSGVISLNDLPDEIIVHVLRCLRASTTLGWFTNVFLVNKKFHKIGASIAYELLALTNQNFDGWYESAKHVGNQYTNVRHLTVTLAYDYPGICDCIQRGDPHDFGEADVYCGPQCLPIHTEQPLINGTVLLKRLATLSWVMRTKLRNLKSFALIIEVEPLQGQWCSCYEPGSCAEQLVKVLAALPPTCESLMLDTAGAERHNLSRDDNSARATCELCEAIGNSMSFLKHLRLSCLKLCPGFLNCQLPTYNGVPSWPLSAFEAWFLAEEIEEWVRFDYNQSYYSDTAPYDLYWSLWNSESEESRQHYCTLSGTNVEDFAKSISYDIFESLISLTINLAISPCQNSLARHSSCYSRLAKAISIAVHDRRCFPNLQACHVIGAHSENPSDQEIAQLQQEGLFMIPSFMTFSELFLFDVMSDTTAVLPFRFLVPEFAMMCNQVRRQQLYAFRDPVKEDLHYGSPRDFDWIIEAGLPYGWLVTATEQHCLPGEDARRVVGLDVEDMTKSCCSRDEMKEQLMMHGWGDIWRRRAEATLVVKRQGLLEHYEIRDPSNGELGTQGWYELESEDEEEFLEVLDD